MVRRVRVVVCRRSRLCIAGLCSVRLCEIPRLRHGATGLSEHVGCRFVERLRQIASLGLPPEVSARMYNVKVVSVLGCLAQVTDAPLAAVVGEAAGRIRRLLGNTLARRSHIELERRGAPRLASAEALCLAACAQTSASTVPERRAVALRIEDAVDEHVVNCALADFIGAGRRCGAGPRRVDRRRVFARGARP